MTLRLLSPTNNHREISPESEQQLVGVFTTLSNQPLYACVMLLLIGLAKGVMVMAPGEASTVTCRLEVLAKTKAASREFMRGSGKLLVPPQVRKNTAAVEMGVTSQGSSSQHFACTYRFHLASIPLLPCRWIDWTPTPFLN